MTTTNEKYHQPDRFDETENLNERKKEQKGKEKENEANGKFRWIFVFFSRCDHELFYAVLWLVWDTQPSYFVTSKLKKKQRFLKWLMLLLLLRSWVGFDVILFIFLSQWKLHIPSVYLMTFHVFLLRGIRMSEQKAERKKKTMIRGIIWCVFCELLLFMKKLNMSEIKEKWNAEESVTCTYLITMEHACMKWICMHIAQCVFMFTLIQYCNIEHRSNCEEVGSEPSKEWEKYFNFNQKTIKVTIDDDFFQIRILRTRNEIDWYVANKVMENLKIAKQNK